MIQLVNDILQLSSLDNASEAGSDARTMETVDLLDGRQRSAWSGRKLNAQPGLTSRCTCLGESALVHGQPQPCWTSCARTCATTRSATTAPAARSRSPPPAAGTATAP